ncbi:uncharacterized protein Triagg1_5237 [Trichoderma aggressivum f. europaeum]|uniref:Lysine-specific metallo-endopeptidase domain-containing protein n=1 Tax=Trichoderma aggressivum f. europaeum TaxID=173218 RepID=A0AAE1IDB4_9HYPO|nr:hypothetical protein Triagg1_5237 [Trichoderma aggressivum f. europaeum]
MLIAFALGLFLSLGRVTGLNVGEANLDIWDVDDSCKPYLPLLQKAFDDAATMSAKALKDLKFVQQPRPQQDTKRRESLEWDRIARAVNTMFGFNPDHQGTNSENKFMQRILEVYDKMSTALHGNENIPAKGFTQLHSKALVMCGDKPWRWYSVNDIDPYDLMNRQLHITQPQVVGGGAWAWKHRYHSNGNPNSIGICRPGIYAVTQTKYDMITFCDSSFSKDPTDLADVVVSPVDRRHSVEEGVTKLDEFEKSLSRVMLHELTHWYGAKRDDSDGTVIQLPDQQAVSKRGELVFQHLNQNNVVEAVLSSERKDGVRYEKASVYGFVRIARLAMSHEGEFAQNSGPKKATDTAEAYTYFAMMA